MGRYESLNPIRYTRLYRIWLNMRTRCNNPHFYHYSRYGGRGIKVCSEWDSYDAFEKWAYENGYKDTLTIDREDNDKGYFPDNCRWATAKEQANNRKSSVYVEHNGEKHTYAEWADMAGIKYKVFMNRIYRGWTMEKALTTPTIREVAQ